MTDIVFKNPPPKSHNHGRNAPSWANVLRARPGEWAMVRTTKYAGHASCLATSYRGRCKFMAGEQWEAASRGLEVYVRYLGPLNNGGKSHD